MAKDLSFYNANFLTFWKCVMQWKQVHSMAVSIGVKPAIQLLEGQSFLKQRRTTHPVNACDVYSNY